LTNGLVNIPTEIRNNLSIHVQYHQIKLKQYNQITVEAVTIQAE